MFHTTPILHQRAISAHAFHFRRFSQQRQGLAARLLDGSVRKGFIDVHPEVVDALHNRRPVVALESAIITHGLPQPTNFTTAISLESIVRSTGAVPATIALIDGRIKVGLTEDQLGRLADREGNANLVKVSTRDIAPSCALGKDGGTTCSATLLVADLLQIKVFATGGLGGVHRGGEDSLDISADLRQLSQSHCALISAGVKSILDIGRTLEYLETFGVPVVTYGKTNDFPAFYSAKSGHKSPWFTDNLRHIAEMLRVGQKLTTSGILVAAPIPEQHEPEASKIQLCVEQAIKESEENGISKNGNQVTPWLLGRVAELTTGASLRSNIALIENTASIGGKLAVEYANMLNEKATAAVDYTSILTSVHPLRSASKQASYIDPTPAKSSAKLIIVGASTVDVIAKAGPNHEAMDVSSKSTTPGRVAMSAGGVARNIAEAAHRILSTSQPDQPWATLLLSPVGDDDFARFLLDIHQNMGMRTDGMIYTPGHSTAVCNMVLDSSGGLVGGVADMGIFEQFPGNDILASIHDPALVAMDGNLSPLTLACLLEHCHTKNIPSFFEPTSIVKSSSILPAISGFLGKSSSNHPLVTYCSPNLLELAHMYRQASSDELDLLSHKAWWTAVDGFGLSSAWRMDLDQLAKQPACPESSAKGSLAFLVEEGVAQMAVNLLPFFQHLVIKCGERGILVAMHIFGDDAARSAWGVERSNPRQRYIVAKGLSGESIVVLQHFPAFNLKDHEILNVTGAGDSVVGSICAGLVKDRRAFHNPTKLAELVRRGQEAAALSLRSRAAVSPLLRYE